MDRQLNKKNRLYRLLSFFIPLAAMLLAFAVGGFYPFGNRLPFRGDACAEYYPYIVLFRRIIQSHESLLYTWRSGLGLSVIPTFGYFGFNPFNLLAYFLPEWILPAYIVIASCIRIALAGYFFSVFLQTVRPVLTPAAVAFSVMFALNSWMIGNSHEYVWLDSIALLPLVCAGLVRAVRDRDYRLYIPAIGFCIAFNYYMGFIVCVMTGMVWIALLIVYRKPVRSLILEALGFLGSSVIGAGFGAVLLIPTVLAIRQTAAYGNTITDWTEVYASLPKLIGSLSPFLDPIPYTHPGFYATSILGVILLGGYLVSGKISLRERLCGVGIFLLLLLSIWYAPLNFVWHGLHYPHVSVQRFGFLVTFVLAFLGWRFTDTLHDLPLKPAGKGITALRTAAGGLLMLGGGAGVILCAVRACSIDVPLIVAVCGGLYFLLYVFYRFFPKRALPFYAVLLVLVCGEMGWNAYLQNSAMKDAKDACRVFPQDDIKQAVQAVNADAQMHPELRGRTSLNYSGLLSYDMELLYDIPQGSTVFNSLPAKELFLFGEKLGFHADHDSCYYYVAQRLNPFAAQLTNMAYTVSNQPVPGYQLLQDGAADGSLLAYKNQYDTAPGFCIPALTALPSDQNVMACDALPQLFTEMTGVDTPLFSEVSEEAHHSEGMTLECAENDYVYKTKGIRGDMDSESKYRPSMQIDYEIPEDGTYYLNLRWNGPQENYGLKLFWIDLNEEKIFNYAYTYTPYRHQFISIGECKKGDRASLFMMLYAGCESSVTARLVRFNDEAFEKGYEILHRSPLQLTSFTQDAFAGTVNAEQDSVLYLSLPYDEGWTAFVDGKQVPVERVLDAMSGIRLTAGQHQIQMRFFPKGLKTGAIVSASCVTVYLLLCIVYGVLYHNKRKTEAPEPCVLADEGEPDDGKEIPTEGD